MDQEPTPSKLKAAPRELGTSAPRELGRRGGGLSHRGLRGGAQEPRPGASGRGRERRALDARSVGRGWGLGVESVGIGGVGIFFWGLKRLVG